MWRSLVFQGGGVKGSAYAGAVEVLEQRGLLAPVERVAGTSAGAITASLLAVGAGSEGLAAAVRETDFGSFLDGKYSVFGDTSRLIKHFGVYAGNQFSELLRAQVKRYAGDAELTLGQLRDKAAAEPGRFRQLYVVASNVTRQAPEVLCAETHPEMPVWQAVRTSMSIPLLFEAVRLKEHLYVDGGLAWNYAIDLFDDPDPHDAVPRAGFPRDPTTLGFAVVPGTSLGSLKNRQEPPPVDTTTVVRFLEALGNYMYETSNHAHFHPDDARRTVFIDDLGVHTTNFKAPASTIEALIDSGRKATTAFLEQAAAPVGGAA